MKNTKRTEVARSVKPAKGLKVKTSLRAGVMGGFNNRDSFGSEYGTY